MGKQNRIAMILGLLILIWATPQYACGCAEGYYLETNHLIFVTIAAYLLGSIPFGLIITKAFGLGDIRKIGSGNIGATNVLRSGNKKAAAATLFLDGFKGYIATFMVSRFAPSTFNYDDASILIGLAMIAVLLGHCFPVWLKFKGGKGVATYIGAVFGIFWPLGIVACMIWAVTAKLLKVSSASALTMVCALPLISSIFLGKGGIIISITLALAALLIIYRHRANISRLLKGTEPRIGKK